MAMTRQQLRLHAAKQRYLAERHLLTFKRCELIDAANTEMINIELERLGMKEVA